MSSLQKPLLATNLFGKTKVLLETGNVDEIESSLKKMFNVDYRNSFINYGLNRAKDFNWENTYKNTLQIYNSLL